MTAGKDRHLYADVQAAADHAGSWGISNRLHQFSVDTASEQRFSGIVGWVMRSPEVSPSSVDDVIAPMILWLKRHTDRI